MAKEKIVGLALVGLGGFSGVIGGGAHRSQKTKLVTCFDILPEKRMEASKKYGCDQEKSYEALVARDDIDGVLLTTPNVVHAEQAVLAAEHGKHVYVIKPIANTIADTTATYGNANQSACVGEFADPRTPFHAGRADASDHPCDRIGCARCRHRLECR